MSPILESYDALDFVLARSLQRFVATCNLVHQVFVSTVFRESLKPSVYELSGTACASGNV
jgi:hypothetical protein